MESGLVPVGAGVVKGGVGLGLRGLGLWGRRHDDIPCGRPSSLHTEARGRPQGSPLHSPTSPAPTGTMGLFPKNLYLKGSQATHPAALYTTERATGGGEKS